MVERPSFSTCGGAAAFGWELLKEFLHPGVAVRADHTVTARLIQISLHVVGVLYKLSCTKKRVAGTDSG
jgi:hypothetical protein